MRALGFLLLTTLLAAPATAQVYRWVDDQGQVHYGQTPPRGKGYERVAPAAPPGDGDAVDAIRQYNEAAEARRKTEREAAAAREQAAAVAAQRCEQARARLRFLDERTAQRLMFVNDDGERERYTEERFQAQRAEALKAIQGSC